MHSRASRIDFMSRITRSAHLKRTFGTLALAVGVLGISVSAHADDASQRLRVFPEDLAVESSADTNDDTPRSIMLTRAHQQAESQVIIAPLPPAVFTGLPLLAGLWVVRHYRTWLRHT